MPTDTAIYSVDNKTMQLYMDLLDPHLTLNDVLNVTAYAVMGCGKDYQYSCWKTFFALKIGYIGALPYLD